MQKVTIDTGGLTLIGASLLQLLLGHLDESGVPYTISLTLDDDLVVRGAVENRRREDLFLNVVVWDDDGPTLRRVRVPFDRVVEAEIEL